MSAPENIILIGPMGAGKTTVGRQLAKALGKSFVDCDREIETRTGASISLIFELEGEEGFRRRESRMLEELALRTNLVLATGGGAVLAPENRSLLAGHGFVIYLKAPASLLAERTARDRSRPLLQGSLLGDEDPRSRLQSIVAERDPIYRELADMIVRTNQRSARYVVREILKRLPEAS